MTEIHHFTYGVFNPIAAYLLAFLGSFFGLLCTGRARDARTRSRRNRWLGIAAFSIGGGGIWLMHFAAMLGFDVPASPVRFDIVMTVLSMVVAVIAVGLGLLIVGHGRRSFPKVLAAGVLTGGGVLAMHYSGMEGLHVAGTMHYNLALVVASAVIAVVASTIALWFAISVRGWTRVSESTWTFRLPRRRSKKNRGGQEKAERTPRLRQFTVCPVPLVRQEQSSPPAPRPRPVRPGGRRGR